MGSDGIENADPKAVYQNLKKSLYCDHLTTEDFRRVRKETSHMIYFDARQNTYKFANFAFLMNPMTFAYLEYHARQLLSV